MTVVKRLSPVFWVVAALTALCGCAATPVESALNADCGAGDAALASMVRSEYAFAASAAATSIRAAFLEYLAEDSVVLSPGPVSGRATYTASKQNKDSLTWYSSRAEIANSGDLGMSSGPWIYRAAAAGSTLTGHFFSLWRRDAACHWHVEFDGGVPHAPAATAEAKLNAESVRSYPISAPGPGNNALRFSQQAEAFAHTAAEQGVAVAVRAYAAADLRLYVTGSAPIDGLGAAADHFAEHALAGVWRELGGNASRDMTLAYRYGEIGETGKAATHAYVALWRSAPKQGGWQLHALVIGQLPKVTT
jgi:hypothetical protein